MIRRIYIDTSVFAFMTPREKDILHLIKDKIKQKDPSADVFLFGSHARGQAHKNSDWDILILLNRVEVSRNLEKEYRDELFEVELNIEEPISTFVFSKVEWEEKHRNTPLYKNIRKEGIKL